MKAKFLLLGIFACLLLQFSCEKNKENLKEVFLKKDTIVVQLGDSSFISDVRSMHFDKFLYLTDYKRDQIIILDKNGKFIKCLGRKGKGPGEFLGAFHLFVQNDTIYVGNDWKRSIEMFSFDNHLKTINLPQQTTVHLNYRFFEKSRKLFFASSSDTNSIASFNMCSNSAAYFGRLVKYNTDKQTRIRNHRHVFFCNNFLIAVSDNMPFVEKYDLTGKLLEIYDYSEILEVKQMINYTRTKKLGINSYYQLITDAYLDNDKLYLLFLSANKDKISSNKLLRIDIKEKMFTQRLYSLGKGWYSAICIGNSYIWAFGQDGLVGFNLKD